MMGWTTAFPRWLPVVVAATAAFAFAWWIQGTRWAASEAQLARDHAQQVEQWANAASDALQAARVEEQRRVAAVETVKNEAIKSASSARADAARLRADLVGLRGQLDTVLRDARGRDSTLANGSPPGASTAGVLAYMLGRAVDRAEFLANFADRARIAGLTCESIYDTVRDTQRP